MLLLLSFVVATPVLADGQPLAGDEVIKTIGAPRNTLIVNDISSFVLGRPFIATGGTALRTLADRATDTIQAVDYGSCTWDAAHDVGACINAAIAEAAALGGRTVNIPAGTFGLSTPIVQNTSGVHLQGAGTGFARDTVSPANALAATRLVWIGAAGATMFLATPGTAVSLYSADVTGILFDCANLAGICAEFQQVSNSTINIAVSEPQSIGAWFTTIGSDAPGNQGDDIWVTSRSTSPGNTFSPTGIWFDAAPASSFNTSFSRVHSAVAWYAQGDGVVFGNTDNLQIDYVSTFGNPGNSSGRGAVFASAGYVMPNGLATTGSAQDSSVQKITGSSHALGFNSGSTIVAGGGNTGTAAVATQSLTTSASTVYNNSSALLTFASVTGIAAGEAVNCGGTMNGIASDNTVSSFTGTTVTLASENIGTVPSGVACTFKFGVTSSAAQGTYTITAASPTTFNITAPASGHSQSAIAYSGGFVSFTDLVLPLTGTPVAGDTFTLTVPLPAKNITVVAVDENNNQPLTYFGAGATGYVGTTTNPAYPSQFGPTLQVKLGIGSSSNQCVYLGYGNGQCSGTFSAVIGGTGSAAFGFGQFVGAGQNNQVGSLAIDSAIVGGQNNTLTGSLSAAIGGGQATDRGRFGALMFGGQDFAVQGDAQSGTFLLRGTGSTGTAFRLTSDGAAAGAANCGNIPNNTAYLLTIDIVAFDHTTVTKNAVWPTWTGLLTRGANAASTAVAMNTTPTPLTNGTLTGQAISVTADTTNGCVNISYTPPTSNTDKFNSLAKLQTVEVQ